MGVLHLLSNMQIISYISVILSLSSSLVLGNESFQGEGTMACYGDMSITFGKAGSGEDEGFLDCQPAWGTASAPPQGIIADGADGSHWVTVDDSHQTRTFCGYADCAGMLTIECSMLSGCHGA